MNTIQTFRRLNLLRVASQRGGTNALGRELGYSSGAYISQITSDNPNAKRKAVITENTARVIEMKLHLPAGALDMPVDIPTGAQPMSVAELTELISAVGEKLDAEHVTLTGGKFATLITLALVDRSHVDQLIKLLK